MQELKMPVSLGGAEFHCASECKATEVTRFRIHIHRSALNTTI